MPSPSPHAAALRASRLPAFLLAALCTSAFPAAPLRAEEPRVFEDGQLRISHPWTRAAEGSEALVFMEIENLGIEPLQLIGGLAGEAEAITLVGHVMQDGGTAVVPIPEIIVEPGAVTELGPDGAAIRLSGLAEPLVEGETLELAVLTTQGTLPVTVRIEAADADGPDGEAATR